MTAPQDESGFTLVEVLVAFAILSLTIIAGLQIFSDGMSRIAKVDARLADLAAEKRLLMDGDAEAQAGRGLRLQQVELSAEVLPWTTRRPVLARTTVEGESGELSLETIQIRTAQ